MSHFFMPCHPTTARRRHPGFIVARVCGGSLLFRHVGDYRTWRNQR